MDTQRIKIKAWISDKKLMTLLIWGTIAFFSILYISLIFNNNVWTDEGFTLKLLKGNFIDITKGTAADVHPPLYYYIAKLFRILFGESLQVQKIAVLIPMVLTLVLGATKVRRYFGDTASFFFILFLACIPCSMEFAVQVRMYSMSIFTVTACGLFAYEAYNEKKLSWIWFVVSGVAAAYLHYFALVTVVIINGMFFLTLLFTKRKSLLKWLIASLCMIIAYLPWLFIFLHQTSLVTEQYWIPAITKETLWGYFKWTFGTNLVPYMEYIFTALLIVCGICNLINILKKKKEEDKYALFTMLVPTLVMITGVIFSLLTRPIYRDQYIFPALGLLALFFGITVSKFKKGYLLLITVFLLFVGAIQYKECFRQEYRSTYVKETESFFKENLQIDDYIIYNWPDYDYIYSYYFPNEQLSYVGDFDFGKEFNIIWFIETRSCGDFPPGILYQYGLKQEFVGHYGIEHNEFDLYAIYREETK